MFQLKVDKIKSIVDSKWYSSIMLLCIYGYTFFSIGIHNIGNIFLGFIILGSIPVLILNKKKLLQDPIVILFLFVILIQIVSWVNSTLFFTEYANNIPKVDRLGKLFVFFFIAFWLQGNIKNILNLWIIFIFGYLLAICIHADYNNVLIAISNDIRVDFSIKNSQFDSMLAGVSFLMLLFFPMLVIKNYNKLFKNLLYKYSLYILISFMMILFLEIILITESRQVWLGLVISLFIGFCIYIVLYKVKNMKLIFSLFIGLSLSIYMLKSSEIVQDRLLKEKDVINSIVSSNKPIEMTSIGIRINSWIEASSWIQKHPIVGLDSVAIGQVIEQSDKFTKELKHQFGHLHNFFIETLVAYGIVGLVLMLLLYYLVLKSIIKSNIRDEDKRYFLLLGSVFIVYWLVINNFETYNSRWLGVFTNNIILGTLYTFYLNSSLKEEKKSLE